MDSLVSTEWLAAHLGESDLAIVDSSVFMPGTDRDGPAEFAESHIPGARFLDIEALSDRADPAPHMLPAADDFARAMENAGVDSGDRIVVYDNSPLRTAARGWFMLRHFGAHRVAVLNGGFQKWVAEGRPVEAGHATHRDASFAALDRSGEVIAKAAVLGSGLPIADARGAARFEGREDDPRPGVAAGHIPGARNIPYASVYAPDGTFRPVAELRQIFAAAGIDPRQPFIASCGSGVTANSLIFAAHLLGEDNGRLYDGSWSEWGADPKTPKALGPAA